MDDYSVASLSESKNEWCARSSQYPDPGCYRGSEVNL